MFDTGMRGFPPRLVDQPIFYPVTNDAYARQIALDWNTKTGSFCGFVTRFSVDDAYAAKFERRVVGAAGHEELWVPAPELPMFNSRIDGLIAVTAAYFGAAFAIDDARATWEVLSRERHALAAVIARDPFSVFVSYLHWQQSPPDGVDVAARDAFIAAIDAAWSTFSAGFPLGLQP